ncbi:DUF4825 domain-containing protein [Psychrobacter pygoscelis]|uniref:DUF4825 domain-containing protein n=1 Tax=Psychrobacter pygoscelis TaxID=2488563 RepID=UPI00103BA320|nr:DUF4825 domain-containing protein [Psychrobacter pygoscelis]
MKPILKLSSVLLAALLIVSGCNSKSVDRDLFEYKGAYVGDNSAVGNILGRLPVVSYSKSFELATVEEAYGVILNYDGSESLQERQQIVVYTATYLFTLIRNADWIRYNFGDQQVEVTKAELQHWYGDDEDLSRFKSEKELNAFIDAHLSDENKINELLQ